MKGISKLAWGALALLAANGGYAFAAAEEGDLRPGVDPALASKLVFGTVNSLIEWYRTDGSVEGETLARSVATVAFDGLASHASR